MENIFDIYLPIAEVNIDVLLMASIGVVVGLFAGLFGLGGGLFLVPILISIGIPSHIAVATSTNQMTAASFSGYLAYARRNRVDYKFGSLMLVGGVIGTVAGVLLFNYLTEKGIIDIFISISFLIMLSFIGFTTSKDAIILLYYKFTKKDRVKPKVNKLFDLIPMPFQVHFPSARSNISIFSPIIVGFMGGIVVSVMGIGGSLLMLPAMIYVLGISEAFTAGTTQFQIMFTTVIATILHSVTSHSLDIVLSTILIVGAAFGVQIGARLGAKFQPDNYRLLLALLMLVLCIKVGCNLTMQPNSLYFIESLTK